MLLSESCQVWNFRSLFPKQFFGVIEMLVIGYVSLFWLSQSTSSRQQIYNYKKLNTRENVYNVGSLSAMQLVRLATHICSI